MHEMKKKRGGKKRKKKRRREIISFPNDRLTDEVDHDP